MWCIYCLFNLRVLVWIFFIYYDSLLIFREDLMFWSFLVCSCGLGLKNLEGGGVCSILFFVVVLKVVILFFFSLFLIFVCFLICICLFLCLSVWVICDLVCCFYFLCMILVVVNVLCFDLDWVLEVVWELDMWWVISGWFVGMIIMVWFKRNYSNLCFNFYNGFLEKL